MRIDVSGESEHQPDKPWSDTQQQIFFHLIHSMGWFEQMGCDVIEGRMSVDFVISKKDLLFYASTYQVQGRQQQ